MRPWFLLVDSGPSCLKPAATLKEFIDGFMIYCGFAWPVAVGTNNGVPMVTFGSHYAAKAAFDRLNYYGYETRMFSTDDLIRMRGSFPKKTKIKTG